MWQVLSLHLHCPLLVPGHELVRVCLFIYFLTEDGGKVLLYAAIWCGLHMIMSISNLFLTEIMLLRVKVTKQMTHGWKGFKTPFPLDPLCKMPFKQWESCRKELWFTGAFKGKLFPLSASCCGLQGILVLFSSLIIFPPSLPSLSHLKAPGAPI